MPQKEPRKLTFHKTMRVYPDGVKAHHFTRGETHDENHPGLQNGWFDRLIDDGDATEGDATQAKKKADEALELRNASHSHDQNHLPPSGVAQEQHNAKEEESLKETVDRQKEEAKGQQQPHKPGPKEVK